MTHPIQILLAEDQPIVRQGLCYILQAQQDMNVVGEAADGKQALQLALQTRPDLILMDIRMPLLDGIEATRAILAVLPETKVILLTTFDIEEYVFEGIRAGAVGYLLKDAETYTLLEGIRAAAQGGVTFRSRIAGEVLAKMLHEEHKTVSQQWQASTLLEPLTEREQAVLQQMAWGKRNWEIAHQLSISEGTVKTHVHRILQKLGVEDRTQAVVLAIRGQIVD